MIHTLVWHNRKHLEILVSKMEILVNEYVTLKRSLWIQSHTIRKIISIFFKSPESMGENTRVVMEKVGESSGCNGFEVVSLFG